MFGEMRSQLANTNNYDDLDVYHDCAGTYLGIVRRATERATHDQPEIAEHHNALASLAE